MRTIVTAITAAALALSLTFQAAPANAAVPGYDSSYAGESAFLNLDQGDSGSFTVFFANTGTTTWTAGSATQVDLAACLEDKVTCNQQDTDEATFNDGWLSATRYATHTQTAVAPGQIGTFTYDVTVPSDAAADTYRFNGALVLASTGADIHNEGYFQDVTVAGGAPAPGEAAITELDPDEGSVEGGETVTITGTGFDCSPEPTVMFGTNAADVASCGDETLTVLTPAADVQIGDSEVDVTVANDGEGASNALTFTYEDDVAPTFDSINVNGQTITLNFSEAVCVDLDDDFAEGDEFQVTINGIARDATTVDDAEFADCDDDEFATTATVVVSSGDAIVAGDTVSLTITTAGAAEVLDQADNDMDRAQTRTAAAEADDTAPAAETADIISTTQMEVDMTEPLDCTGADADDFTFDSDTSGAADAVATAVTCDSDEITLTFASGTFSQGETGTLEYDGEANDIEDLSGNDLADFDIEVTELEADPPLIDDAALSASAGFSSMADSGDEFTLEFSEPIAALVVGDTIRVQDEDGTIADITCDTIIDIEDQTVTVDDADNDLGAACELDTARDTLRVQVREDSSAGTNDTDEVDNLVIKGEVSGLQWPATIIDTSGLTDDEGNDPDLSASDDVVIDDE